MLAFAGIFDFSMQRAVAGVAEEDDRWCFIENLSSKYKILVDLMAPAIIFTMFLILYISTLICRRRLRIRHKKLNLSAASLAVFLFIVGKILQTLFKMLACKSVGNDLYVHWYFAYDECYGTEWAISMTTLLLIIIGFAVPFGFAWKMTTDERYDKASFIYQVSARFKPQFWYWEYILFARRITISFFAVCTSSVQSKLLFLFIMVCFIVVQWKLEPFRAYQVEFCSFFLCLPCSVCFGKSCKLTIFQLPSTTSLHLWTKMLFPVT